MTGNFCYIFTWAVQMKYKILMKKRNQDKILVSKHGFHLASYSFQYAIDM